MEKNDLSRKGVFGSIWRWFKGKMFSSYKLSLNVSSSIDEKKKKKKVEDLVKKITKWDVSYYPLDRINSILSLDDNKSNNLGSGKCTISWYDLDEQQKLLVRSKLVGFINSICFGDYTGAPSWSQRKEILEELTNTRTNVNDCNDLSDPLYSVCVMYYGYKNDEDNQKLKGVLLTEYNSYYLWIVSRSDFDDGMNGKYAKLLRQYAKPMELDGRLRYIAGYDIFLNDMDDLLKNPNSGKKEIYKLAKKNNWGKGFESKWISDRIEKVQYGLKCKNYDRSKDLLTIGIKLLDAIKDTDSDPLAWKDWNDHYKRCESYIQKDRYKRILQVYYLTHPGDHFTNFEFLKYNFKDKDWAVITVDSSYYGLFVFNNMGENVPYEYVYMEQVSDKLIKEMKTRNIKPTEEFEKKL